MSAQRRASRTAADRAKAKERARWEKQRTKAQAHMEALRQSEANLRQSLALNAQAQQQIAGRLRMILEELGEVPPLDDPPAPRPVESPPDEE